MKINIYLNFFRGIAGGYKVIYQYANYFSKKGYDVVIYYDLHNGENSKRIPKKIVYILRKLYLNNYPYYYPLDKKIKQIGVANIENKNIRNADIGIFTSPNTAHSSKKLSKEKGKSIYFIQGYEDWWNDKDYLHQSYKLCDINVVISNWLKEIVDSYSNKESIVITNGIDITKFKKNNGIEKIPYSIAYIYHKDSIKGCEYGIDALLKLKKKYKELQVFMFGNPKRPKNLPDWINYVHKASENEVIDIFNKCEIYICSSIHEGFGLPGLEAMACQCAVITTDCLGPREYANNKNAFICKIKDSYSIFNEACEALDNKILRNKKIKEANKTISNWDIKNSLSKFDELLAKIMN